MHKRDVTWKHNGALRQEDALILYVTILTSKVLVTESKNITDHRLFTWKLD